MIKRPSSIKGRGEEILVGVPQTAQVKPGGSGQPPAEPESSEPESPDSQPGAGEGMPAAAEESAPTILQEGPTSMTDADLARALYAEARDAEPAPAGKEEPWSPETGWPPTPEMELALFEDSPAAGESPQPAGQASTLTAEKTVEANDLKQGAAAPEVAQAVSSSVLPARSISTYAAMAQATATDSFDLQSPEEPVERLELPAEPLTDEQKAQLGETTSARIQALDQEIDQVYDQVLNEVGENDSIATECFNQLLKARDIVVRRDVARLSQAEYYVEQARARLKRVAISAVGARRHAWWILAWGLIWGMVYVSTLILLDSAWAENMIAQLELRSTFVDPNILLPAMVWGGIGGVVAIWYSLFKHVAERDFDRAFNITYLAKPFFGLVLGATVYMVANLLIVSLGVWPANSSEGAGAATLPTIAPWIIYLAAWACGFKENRVFGLVDQAMKRIFSSGAST